MGRKEDTEHKKREILRLLGERGGVAGALRELGIDIKQYKRWRKSDPDFAAQADLILGSHNAAKAEKRHGRSSGARRKSGAGEKGDKGDPGTPGKNGDKGDKGDPGAETADEMPGLRRYEGPDLVELAAHEAERLRAAMKARGVYAEYLEPRIGLAAQAWGVCVMMRADLERYAALQETVSREGDLRLAVNPLPDAYNKQLDRYARHLKALKLDLSEEGAPAQSSRSSFFAALEEDE